jgi:hypothetical protein
MPIGRPARSGAARVPAHLRTGRASFGWTPLSRVTLRSGRAAARVIVLWLSTRSSRWPVPRNRLQVTSRSAPSSRRLPHVGFCRPLALEASRLGSARPCRCCGGLGGAALLVRPIRRRDHSPRHGTCMIYCRSLPGPLGGAPPETGPGAPGMTGPFSRLSYTENPPIFYRFWSLVSLVLWHCISTAGSVVARRLLCVRCTRLVPVLHAPLCTPAKRISPRVNF